jgi:hypothetical protein
MAQYVNVTLKNSTSAQHVYHATDLVMGDQALPDTPIAPDDPPVPIRLVAGDDGHGHMIYGYRGGVDVQRDDLNDGDPIDG